MTTPQSMNLEALTQRLQRRAVDYFPDLAGRPVRVTLVKRHRRRHSLGYEFLVEGDPARRGIFVKAPLATAAQAELSGPESKPATVDDRPRLVPLLPIAQEARYEHAALAAMNRHFAAHADGGLGVPRLLEAPADTSNETPLDGLLIVEAIRLPTLAQRLRGAARWTSPNNRATLVASCANAGRWLRLLHDMPPAAGGAERLATRSEWLARFVEFVDYLQRAGVGLGRSTQGLTEEVARMAEACLPSRLPLVTGHGDFGLHNLFADAQGGVIGFDTLAYWRTAPGEDIAYFLTMLESPPPLFLPRWLVCRRSLVAEMRQALMGGYFGERQPPLAELALYEIIIATDKLVSAVHSARRGKRVRGAAKRMRLVVQQKMLIARIRALLDERSALSARPPADHTPADYTPAEAVVSAAEPRVGRTMWEQVR